MQAIVFTLINVGREIIEHMDAGFCFMAQIMVYLWNLNVVVIEWMGAFVISAFALLFEVGVELFVTLIKLATAILPGMPTEPGDNIAISGIAQANVYVPVSELVALTGAWSAVFAAVGLYKMSKFIRGGG